MKYLSIVAVVLSVVAASSVFAEDCSAKFSPEQQKIYSTLSADSKQTLATGLKMRDGSAPTCEFRAGLMDMMANFPPEKRDAALKQLVEKMLIKHN